ncbi:MAG: transketolase family protein [Spirochaetia bacterium]|nr:transketolase family protein [Spirochaetia bacterium]
MNLPNIDEKIMPRVSFGEALVELAEQFPTLRVFDADVCASTQTVYFRDKYPTRFYQMGIAEANMVGAAAGMATVGLTPFISTFAVFLAKRALDQIRVSVAYPNLNVKINGAYGGLPTGQAGATHSSVQDISIMRSMPNMKVLVPGDPLETKLAVKLALETPGPVYLRTVRCAVPVIFDKGHTLTLGKGEILHEGKDVAIISTGMMTPRALYAARSLAKEGIRVRHIHFASIKPIDEEMIRSAAQDCGIIVTVENHGVLGGLGGAVAEVVGDSSPCIVKRLGFPDIFLESGDDEAIFHRYNLSEQGIVETVKNLLKK